MHYDNNEKKLTTERYLPRQKASQPQRKKNGFKEVEELRFSEMRDKKISLAKAPSKTTVIPLITSIVLSMFNITDDVTNA